MLPLEAPRGDIRRAVETLPNLLGRKRAFLKQRPGGEHGEQHPGKQDGEREHEHQIAPGTHAQESPCPSQHCRGNPAVIVLGGSTRPV